MQEKRGFIQAVFIGLLLLSLGSLTPTQAQSPEWENPAVFQRNQTELHVPLVPYSSIPSALRNSREVSPYFLSLNGNWKFDWSPNPQEAPEDFYQDEDDVSGWDEIRVPSNWQMEGYGYPLFRNVALTIPVDPPHIPEDFNPVGSYRRTFTLPANWDERQVFLHFEGVKSASRVWVNGEEVGYNQGGMEPAEYDITAYLRSGENTIAVKVLRYSDGTYLEAQDMWRLSGIYRDVYLFAAPKVHIRDFYVRTDLDDQYQDADLQVGATIRNYSSVLRENYQMSAQLYDAGGDEVLDTPLIETGINLGGEEEMETTLSHRVENPEKWSAEQPNLYTLILTLRDNTGAIIEVLEERVGFREVEMRNRAIYINGKQIKFNGTNRHEHHPVFGRYVPRETDIKDIKTLKRFNINLVRTSHYPNDPEFLDLCDEYGLYIVGETGDEAHASTWLSEEPAWRDMYVDRARKMVHRDKNHPSVVIWSAGNEAGSGENIAALIEEGKRIDPSRPGWLYGGNAGQLPYEDIIGPRYPHPDELEKLGKEVPSTGSRPSFMDEYIAATGNGVGQFEEYWDLIYEYDRLTGGAIWDWVSPSLKRKVSMTPDASAHHNDGAVLGWPELVEGYSGKGLALSGHDEWVEMYRDESLDVTGDRLTLALWVYPRGWNGFSNPFITKGNHQFGLRQISEDSLEFFIYDGERVSASVETPPSWNNHWHHLAGVYDGETLQLYLNGEVVASTSHTGDVDHNPYPVNVGKNAETQGQSYPGKLGNAIVDEVRIFRSALSGQQLNAVIQGEATPSDDAALWLDFETTRENGTFYSLGIDGRDYGLVWADRSIQPELWQVKKTPQPVKVEAVDALKGEFKITNRFNFTNLNALKASWTLYGDVHPLQNGMIELSIPPGESKTVRLPFARPNVIAPGTEYRILFRFTLPEKTQWAQAGHEVAWEQIDIPFEMPDSPQLQYNQMAGLSVEENSQEAIVTGTDFNYRFDKRSGTLSSIRYQGQELIEEGPLFSAWRAPISNEKDHWGGAIFFDQWWKYPVLYDPVISVESVQVEQLRPQVVRISVSTEMSGELTAESMKDSRFQSDYVYHIYGSGDILLQNDVTPRGDWPAWIPKIGINVTLPGRYQNFSWYGRGPFETYPDRKTGAKVGVYSETTDEQYNPYLHPQDYGNKTDVRWAALTDGNGIGLLVSGVNELVNVRAQQYDTENLSKARYSFQLNPRDAVTLSVDHRLTGVGGTPIPTLKKYRTLPKEYSYTIRIRPFSSGEMSPMELSKQQLPRP